MCLAGRAPAWHMDRVVQVVPMFRFDVYRMFCGPFLALALMVGQTPAQAQASSAEAQAEKAVAAPRVAALAREGYSDITVDWTWLGRLRISARLEGQRREIILHPTTGEVLRDLSVSSGTVYAQEDGSSPDTAFGNLPPSTSNATADATEDPSTTLTLDVGSGESFDTDPSISAVGTGFAP